MRSTLVRSRKCASDWLTRPENYLRSLDQNDVSEQTRSNEMSPIQLPKDVVRILILRTSFLAKPIPEPSGFKHLDLHYEPSSSHSRSRLVAQDAPVPYPAIRSTQAVPYHSIRPFDTHRIMVSSTHGCRSRKRSRIGLVCSQSRVEQILPHPGR